MATVRASQILSTEPPSAIAQNFARLLDIGVAAAQRLSSDHWTDFNEHDPGVTILEALTYALTDLSYRIDHPIEDLIASSMNECDIPLEQQPLFTGDQVLTCAAHSEHDFRKLAYDKVRGLRDLWIIPASGNKPGVHQVYVQRYNSGANDLPDPDAAEILQEVYQILNANRPLGEDFLYPQLVPRRELKLKATISIAAEATPEAVLARILFRIGQKINPPPQLREVEQDMASGVAPDDIYNGPRLEMGWIPDDSLPPLGTRVSGETIADTILSTDQVTGLHAFKVCYTGPQDGVAQMVLSSEVPDPDVLVIRRDGVKQRYDGQRVIAYVRHKEESARWATSYASNRTDALRYASVPLGRPDRNLGRYRSIQHLFPSVYRLGRESEAPGAGPATSSHSRPTTTDDPQAARMQLKAYLLFFEQLLADALSQIAHTAKLFSFSAHQQRTYYPQPLVPQTGQSLDAPPDIARVLGAGDTKDDWWSRYAERLSALSAGCDPVPERLNAMRSALLARFGAEVADERLWHLQSKPESDPRNFVEKLAEQKREYLANIVEIERDRAHGLDPLTGTAPDDIAQAIRVLTGHDGMIEIVDHVLLHPVAQDSTAQAEHGPCFAAALSEIDRHKEQRWLHILTAGDGSGSLTSFEHLRARFLKLAAEPDNIKMSPVGGYSNHLRIGKGEATEFFVIEDFLMVEDADNAREWIAGLANRIVAGDPGTSAAIHSVEVPLDFYGRRLSVFLGRACGASPNEEYEAFVASTLGERLPAHLRHQAYWLDHDHARTMGKEIGEWRAQLSACRKNIASTQECLNSLDQWSERLRLHIGELDSEILRKYKRDCFRVP